MWIIYALIVHLLLLGSIFVIYFRSPVISSDRLKPQHSLKEKGFEAPAKRLVLIVTDGLRAESFFRENCQNVPHLRQLILQEKAIVGVSHTRVPTESRPGHIALIGGLYEDPSAVTRGWKENPIDFDTVFNRSSHTYAWGANDVLHIFSRLNDGGRSEKHIFIDAYDHDLDFSGQDNTYELDQWVFDRVHKFLDRKSEELRQEDQIIFFLHLLGLDSAGHIHKPGSAKFLENLHGTEAQIVKINKKFETIFPDGRTAFIMTSDHGMTDAGAHGAGATFETETPFLLWGAGFVQTPRGVTPKGYFSVNGEQRALFELEQAQFTPLMSALIGVSVPMNNFGILPIGYLNTTPAYEAAAATSNTMQLLEQFRALLAEHQSGLFSSYLRQYKELNNHIILNYEQSLRELGKREAFEEVLLLNQNVMHLALDGIDYYHGYYRNILLVSTTATFLGWILYLLQLLMERRKLRNSFVSRPKYHIINIPLVGICLLFIIVMCLQRVPFSVMIYTLLPFAVWLLALNQRGHMRNNLSLCGNQESGLPKKQILLIALSAEFLVLTFFQRQFISFAFLLYEFASNWRGFVSKNLAFYMWLILVITLAAFPLLPPSVGYKNEWLVYLAMILTFLRSYLFAKTRLSNFFNIVNGIALVNGAIGIYQHSQNTRIALISQCISWAFLVYSFVSVTLNKSVTPMKQRLELIFFNFTSLYSLLCTSYEAIFILMLSTALLINLSSQKMNIASKLALNEDYFKPESTTASSSSELVAAFRLAFAILLYTFFSFFGTGNIASVSSFDPNIVRCFLTTFSPFIIMALVILKLIIPVILNISIIYSISKFVRSHERQIFICLLIICDIMGLNFLYLVKNKGSWLDIGSSISHFVIMEVTTLVLLILTILAKLLLRLPIDMFGIKQK